MINIWVVEHDDALRAAISFALNARGYLVRTFVNAGSVLDACGECTCLIIDQDLREPDGLGLATLLRQSGNNAPAILIVNDVNIRIIQRARALDVRLIQKPLLGDDLIIAVQNAVNEGP